MDINSSDANKLDSSGLLDQYGFTRPLLGMKEPWHIEPKGLRSEGAKSVASDSPNPGTTSMPSPKITKTDDSFARGMNDRIAGMPATGPNSTTSSRNTALPETLKVSVDNKDVVDETVKTNVLLSQMVDIMRKNNTPMTGAQQAVVTGQPRQTTSPTIASNEQRQAQPSYVKVEPIVSTRRVS